MAYDLSSATNAVKTLIAFPTQINTASGSLNGIALGPWAVSVNCSFGDCNAGNCSYTKSIDFTSSRTQLLGILGSINQNSVQFLGTLKGELQSLHNIAILILGELQSLGQEATNPQLENKDSILRQLNTIAGQLAQNSNELVSDNQSFAKFGSELHGLVTTLSNTQSGMEQNISTTIQDIRNYINGQPCGSEGANAQLDIYKALFNNSINSIHQSFNSLYGQCQNAENAVNILIGTFSTFVMQWNSAIQTVTKATDAISYNAAIANLDIHIALLQWTDFSNEIDQINL